MFIIPSLLDQSAESAAYLGRDLKHVLGEQLRVRRSAVCWGLSLLRRHSTRIPGNAVLFY